MILQYEEVRLNKYNKEKYHKLYGKSNSTRLVYNKSDFLDYLLMTLICFLIVRFTFGANHILTLVSELLLAFMGLMFPFRHGFRLSTPILIKKPLNLIFLLYHKLENIPPLVLVAFVMLLIEDRAVRLTPQFPHGVELMRQLSFFLFYLHLSTITGFRTFILLAHQLKAKHVKVVLMNSPWSQFISKQKSIRLEILHSYFTGLLAHITMLVPWYLVICNFNRSVIFFPLTIGVIILSKFFSKWKSTGNGWYYRDHWLGHNSDIDFVYLHGPHHDAIPSGLLAVSDHGFLEGTLRHFIGYPVSYLNPLLAFIVNTVRVWEDIVGHQYIPGVYPYSRAHKGFEYHHAEHHHLSLIPYGTARRNFDGSPCEDLGMADIDDVLDSYDGNNKKWENYKALRNRFEVEATSEVK